MPHRDPTRDSRPVRLILAAISRLAGPHPDRERVHLVWDVVLDDDLRERVGEQLADRLNDSELDEFEQLTEGDDEEAVRTWLATRIPDYAEIAEAELHAVVRIAAERLVEHAAGQPGPREREEEAARGR